MTTTPSTPQTNPQQPQQGQPTNVNVYAAAPTHAQQKNGMAVAGFILSLCTGLLFIVPGLNFVCWLLGLIFSCVGLSRANKLGLPHRGLAIAGIVISLAGFALAIIGMMIIFGAFAAST